MTDTIIKDGEFYYKESNPNVRFTVSQSEQGSSTSVIYNVNIYTGDKEEAKEPYRVTWNESDSICMIDGKTYKIPENALFKDMTVPISSPSSKTPNPQILDVYNPIYSGMYLSKSNVQMRFHIFNTDNPGMIYVSLDGSSPNIQKLNLKYYVGIPGSQYCVTRSEYDNFKNNIINKGIEWSVNNNNNEKVTIPGTWFNNEGFNIIETSNKVLYSARTVLKKAYTALETAITLTNLKDDIVGDAKN